MSEVRWTIEKKEFREGEWILLWGYQTPDLDDLLGMTHYRWPKEEEEP